ncbi:hypothetical protein ACFW24_22260 [Streptomyces nigra]|uniref:hypothetical protein n=1 Tax=Streptomyces nigra TaxID=1827580 RepID=UPI00367E7EFB
MPNRTWSNLDAQARHLLLEALGHDNGMYEPSEAEEQADALRRQERPRASAAFNWSDIALLVVTIEASLGFGECSGAKSEGALGAGAPGHPKPSDVSRLHPPGRRVLALSQAGRRSFRMRLEHGEAHAEECGRSFDLNQWPEGSRAGPARARGAWPTGWPAYGASLGLLISLPPPTPALRGTRSSEPSWPLQRSAPVFPAALA